MSTFIVIFSIMLIWWFYWNLRQANKRCQQILSQSPSHADTFPAFAQWLQQNPNRDRAAYEVIRLHWQIIHCQEDPGFWRQLEKGLRKELARNKRWQLRRDSTPHRHH